VENPKIHLVSSHVSCVRVGLPILDPKLSKKSQVESNASPVDVLVVSCLTFHLGICLLVMTLFLATPSF